MNNQHPAIETPGQLMRRYAYQFHSDTLRYEFFKGWFDICVKLCADVEALLGTERHGFQWVQFKEKFGTARFQYRMGFFRRDDEERSEDQERVARAIFDLVQAAQSRTAHMCIVCGTPGTLNHDSCYVLTLCDFHAQLRLSGGKIRPFTLPRDDIEGEQR